MTAYSAGVWVLKARMRASETIAASAAKQAPSASAHPPPVTPSRAMTSAASAAPTVWPVNRAVPSMPPAAPLRTFGAEVIRVVLLGDWKNPNPAPQSAKIGRAHV